MDVAAPCEGPKRVTEQWIYVLTALLWLSDAIATGTLFDVYLSDLALRQHGKPDEFVVSWSPAEAGEVELKPLKAHLKPVYNG